MILGLPDGFDDVLVQPFMPDGAVVTFDAGGLPVAELCREHRMSKAWHEFLDGFVNDTDLASRF